LRAIPRALANQGCKLGIKGHDVCQISRERDQLQRDQPDMSISSDKKLGSQMNCDSAGNIHQKESRQQQPEVDPLIACDERIQPLARVSGAIPPSHANQAQIIRKQQPTDREECCYEREPAHRVTKLCECKRLHQRTSNIEKIVPEL